MILYLDGDIEYSVLYNSLPSTIRSTMQLPRSDPYPNNCLVSDDDTLDKRLGCLGFVHDKESAADFYNRLKDDDIFGLGVNANADHQFVFGAIEAYVNEQTGFEEFYNDMPEVELRDQMQPASCEIGDYKAGEGWR